MEYFVFYFFGQVSARHCGVVAEQFVSGREVTVLVAGTRVCFNHL